MGAWDHLPEPLRSVWQKLQGCCDHHQLVGAPVWDFIPPDGPAAGRGWGTGVQEEQLALG